MFLVLRVADFFARDFLASEKLDELRINLIFDIIGFHKRFQGKCGTRDIMRPPFERFLFKAVQKLSVKHLMIYPLIENKKVSSLPLALHVSI